MGRNQNMNINAPKQLTDILGWGMASLLTILLFPEVFHAYRNRTSSTLPWGFLSIQMALNLTSLAYAICLNALPFVVANCLSITSTMFVIVSKISFAPKQEEKMEKINIEGSKPSPI